VFLIPGNRLVRATLAGLLLCSLVFASAQQSSKLLKIEAQLVWGTNDGKSPDPKHKPVDADVRKKFENIPFKYTNYFEVNRQTLEVPVGGSQRKPMSKKCEIEIKDLGNDKIEVANFSQKDGQNKELGRGSHPLPKHEILILGGNAPNSNAWFVVLKRVE
jgi:hypothetical protein